jgi:hypothetical protein
MRGFPPAKRILSEQNLARFEKHNRSFMVAALSAAFNRSRATKQAADFASRRFFHSFQAIVPE